MILYYQYIFIDLRFIVSKKIKIWIKMLNSSVLFLITSQVFPIVLYIQKCCAMILTIFVEVQSKIMTSRENN